MRVPYGRPRRTNGLRRQTLNCRASKFVLAFLVRLIQFNGSIDRQLRSSVLRPMNDVLLKANILANQDRRGRVSGRPRLLICPSGKLLIRDLWLAVMGYSGRRVFVWPQRSIFTAVPFCVCPALWWVQSRSALTGLHHTRAALKVTRRVRLKMVSPPVNSSGYGVRHTKYTCSLVFQRETTQRDTWSQVRKIRPADLAAIFEVCTIFLHQNLRAVRG